MFVLHRGGLQFIIVMFFKGNGEAGTCSIITALDNGERKLSLDDAFLYAAQHSGLEIELECHNEKVIYISGPHPRTEDDLAPGYKERLQLFPMYVYVFHFRYFSIIYFEKLPHPPMLYSRT